MLQFCKDLRGANCEAVDTLKRNNQRMVERLCVVWTPRLSILKDNTPSHFFPPKKHCTKFLLPHDLKLYIYIYTYVIFSNFFPLKTFGEHVPNVFSSCEP